MFFPLLLSYMINYILISSIGLLIVFLALSPTFSLFLLAITAPIINLNFNFAIFEIPFSDAIALLAFFAWLLSLFYNLAFQPKTKINLRFPLFFPFLCFIAANALSLFNHPQPLSGFYYITRWLILLYAAYIFLPVNLIKKEKTLKITVLALALSSLILMISGWLSLWGQDWQDSFFRIRSIAWWGFYPFGENHNLIAEFLNAGAFLWLVLKEWTTWPRLKRLFNILFIISLAAVIMTFSRAAWITLALQLSIYILWRQRRYWQTRGALFFLAIIAVVLLSLPILARMQALQIENTSSTENRVLLLKIAYQSWRDKLILGQGSGRFTELVADNIRFTAKYGEAIDSHGFLQKIAAENGIFGLLAWLFLLIVVLKKAILALKKYGQEAPWLLPLWLAGGGAIFFQIFNTSYYKGKVWLLITLAIIASELAAKKYGQKN
jgi:O-antigen ligase